MWFFNDPFQHILVKKSEIINVLFNASLAGRLWRQYESPARHRKNVSISSSSRAHSVVVKDVESEGNNQSDHTAQWELKECIYQSVPTPRLTKCCSQRRNFAASGPIGFMSL